MCLRAGLFCLFFFFFQAEDGIRYLVRSRGLGDVYKRQGVMGGNNSEIDESTTRIVIENATFDMYNVRKTSMVHGIFTCLLYTSDAADERSSVDLGGRRIIKKKKNTQYAGESHVNNQSSTLISATRIIPALRTQTASILQARATQQRDARRTL